MFSLVSRDSARRGLGEGAERTARVLVLAALWVAPSLMFGCGGSGNNGGDAGAGARTGGVPSIQIAAQRLDPPPASWPRVAVDGHGDALVVWERNPGTNSTVAVAALHDGTWQPVRELGSGFAPIPVLRADGSGFVIHSVEEPAGSSYTRWTRLVPYDGSDFGAPLDLADFAWEMDAGVLDDGEAVVIMTGAGVRIYRTGSGAWGSSQEPLPATPAAPVYAPRLARGPNGWIASWYEIAGSSEAIMLARGDGEARNFGDPQPVLNLMPHLGGAFDSCLLQASSRGSTISAIRGSHVIQAALADAGTSQPVLLNDDTAINAPTGPSAGIDASGSGWVLWGRAVADFDWQLLARRFSGDGFRDAVPVDEGSIASTPGLAVRADGTALALWVSVGLFGAVATSDGFGPSAQLLDRGVIDSSHDDALTVVVGPAGHTVAAWLAADGIVATSVIW